jgi:hypothetical protein
MRTLLIGVVSGALALSLSAQNVSTAKLTEISALPQVLNFEDQQAVGTPTGWTSSPEETVSTDDKIVHGGQWAARLERKADSPGGFSNIHRAVAMGFAGKTVELRGFLRLEDVTGFAGFWMREDGEGSTVAFDNMQSRQLKGTSDWTEYSVTLPVQAEGRQLFFGVLLVGTGRVWADDLQLLVDSKPVGIGFVNVPDITPDTAVHVPEPKRIGCTLILRSGAKTNSTFRSSMCLSMPFVSCPSGQVTMISMA